MNKLSELKTVTTYVKDILEKDEKARNSDSYLYMQILNIFAYHKNVDIHKISVVDFLINMRAWGFPAFETVRRTRQKVQEHFPELAGAPEIAEFRKENEEAYREYARG